MNIENQEIQKKTLKEFIKNNKKKIIYFSIILFLSIAGAFGFNEHQKKKNLLISQEFNQAKILGVKNLIITNEARDKTTIKLKILRIENWNSCVEITENKNTSIIEIKNNKIAKLGRTKIPDFSAKKTGINKNE